MTAQNQAADQFEAFFRRADLDGDGRISGAEAVAFFQGSNLPKQVLAQIWMHADQSRTGYLGRQEFYNALKLVTVAQSKRDLTPDIVKAALYGPAAAKIPPPQINLSAIPGQQINPMAAASTPQQMSAPTPMASQSFSFRGPGIPSVSGMQQPIRPSQTTPRPNLVAAGPEFFRGGSVGSQTQTMSAGIAPHPPTPMPALHPSTPMPASHPPTHMPAPHPPAPMPAGPNVPNPNASSDWLSGRTSGPPPGPVAVSPSAPRSVSPSASSAALSPQSLVSSPSPQTTNNSKSPVVSGNGFASDPAFGGDVFSAFSTTIKQDPSVSTSSPGSSSALSASVPVSRAAQPLGKSNSLGSLQSAFSMQPPASAGSQLQRNQSSSNSGQQISAQSSPSFASSGQPPSGQPPWPKMKPSDIQKYLKVFNEVDTDRDGRITGEQARNLFMSWRLPREVLKQVWDLSDQDSDSMLSSREFCFALYLMERYREGRPLPDVLPRNVMFDETLLSMTGQPNAAYGNPAWSPSPAFGQHVMGARSMTPAAASRPPVPVPTPTAGGATMFNQQKSRAPSLDDSFANQLDNGKQNTGNSEVQEATAAGEKVDGTEKVILDSREKIEFYRTKMQELVLYRSRCDNRLNEITERALADKREAEALGKKYEEKYKQVAEIASKLTIEEAKFRELQARKMELHQAIINMEQGGSADGILQVRADRIQSDLEELLKALTERCKKHGFDAKSSALIELPFGWQPGIQEGAAVWDEEWDKFEDEGFGNELTFDGKNASANGSLTPDSLSNVDEKARNVMNIGEHALESESAYTHSEDEFVRSPHGSPDGRSTVESPSQEFSDTHFGRSSEADAETHRSFDESTWGAFDNNDDTDSVWGFNPVNTKVSDSDSHRDFFGSSNFGVNPIRTESPSADSTFQRKSPFFEDSVPSTPLSRFGNSPPRYSDVSAADHFDSFSRFDSFSMHDSGFSSHSDKLARFDSMNSSKDFGTSHFGTDKFGRFDSINSTRDFGNEKLARFDSINSTKDFGNSHGFYSFDDTDPFGSSGPFKVSTDSSSKDKFSLDSNSKEKF